MKTLRWFAAGAAVILLLTLVLWRTSSPPRAQRNFTAAQHPARTPAAPNHSAAQTKITPAVVSAAVTPSSVAEPSIAAPAITAFDDWAQQFIKADATQRRTLLAQAETLGNARRDAMVELIRQNPEQALALALPYGVRKQLPESVAALIEQPLSTRGSLRPHVNHSLAEHGPENCRVDGLEVEVEQNRKKKKYRAYTYGARLRQPPHESMYLHGIKAGDVVALPPEAARVITDKEEIADLAAAGKLDLEQKCQSCSQPVVAASASVLEYGEKFYSYCQPKHAGEFNEQLTEAHSMIWEAGAVAVNPPDQLPPPGSSGTQGIKKLLYIRVTYPDDPRIPQTDDDAYATAEANNRFFNTGSYNTVWWETTVTPVIRLPRSKVNYGEEGGYGDALAAAAAMGYFASDYRMTYVLTTSVPQFLFGGISSGILNNSPGALSHELGHNFGLPHANFYQPEGRNPGPTNNTPFPTDPDSILIGHNDINAPVGRGGPPKFLGDPTAEAVYEYGHPFDTMGGGGQFNAYFKRTILNWLPEGTIYRTLVSTTNRIYAFDVPRITEGRTYAIVTPKIGPTEYWLSYRQGVANNPWFASGIEIMLNRSTVLIDTTPDSTFGRRDAALVVGRTFHDSQANLHITPVAISDSPEPTNRWIDVVVQIGDFPENQPPTLSISADAITITNGGMVTFSSIAQDSNGDQLAYYWDFGDHTFGTNGPTQSKTYANSGVYVARCEVSDLKGGVASRHVVVRVGEPDTFTISGRVVDQFGNGVQGVRVHNSEPRPSDNNSNVPLGTYRYGYSDSDGYYVIGNVPAGTYTLRGFLYGYKTAPQNFNDRLVVADGDTTDFDFLAAQIPRVKIAETTDAKEPGEDGVTSDEEGHFIITRDGDTSEDLRVRFEPVGLTGANLSSDTATIVFDQSYFIIPAGFSSVDLRFTPQDNGVGSGNSSVGLRLLLATNDVRYTTVLTNVLTTNGTVITTNTMFVTRTNNLSIPGWELRPSGPSQALTWFQTDPTYVLGLAQDFVQIIDDDPPGIPQVNVGVLDSDVLESSGDTAALLFFRNGAPITNDLTIAYGLSGIASNNLDYTGLSGTVTIRAGQSTAIVYATAVNDLFVEGNESATVTILADSADPARYTGAGSSASFLVVDDDLPLVNIFASDSRATRGGGGGVITFSRAGTLTEDLTVNYLVTGTALPGVDFTPLAGSIVIPAGELSIDLPINVIATSTSSLPRTVAVQISDSTTYNIYNENAATVTIVDGNLPIVTISGGADIGENGGNTSFTVTRTGPTTNSLNVFFEVGGTAWEGIDYSSIGTNIVIPAGSDTANITLSGINDSARENGRVLGAETIIIQLRAGTNYLLGSGTARSIRLNDDEGDSALPAVGFLLATSTVREDAGSAAVYVRVSANPATNRPIEVEYRIIGGTAVPNVNYVPNSFDRGATGLLHFIHVEAPDPAPIISDAEGSLAVIFVPILNDGVSTANRSLTLTLMNPAGYVTNVSYVTNNNIVFSNTVITRVPTNAFLGPSLSHTLTIQDVGTSFVSITPSSGLAYELGSQPVRFTVTRSGATNVPLTVAFAANGSGANGSDFTMSTNGTITIPAGTNSAVLTMIPRDDPTEETAESMTVSLLPRPGYSLGSPSSATVILVSDDGTLQFLLANYDVSENTGIASIPVVRSGNTNISVSVSFVISNRTATAGSDYVLTNGTVTFAPGETLKSFEVQLIDDLAVEPDETLSMALFNPSGGVPLGGQKTATLTIVNDDTEFNFAVATFRGNENASTAAVVIARSGVISNAQTVTFIAADSTAGAADFVATNIVIEFAPGQTNATVAVAVLDDSLFEGDENVALQLVNPTGGASLGTVSTGTLVLVDDEFRLDFQVSQYFAREYSNVVTLMVRRVGGTVNPVSATFTTEDGSAINGNDYQGGSFTVTFAGDRFELDTNGTGQLTFIPGDAVKAITIGILDDVEGEGNEDFTVTLINPQVLVPGSENSVELGANTNATVTILDNETPGNVDYEFVSGTGPNAPVRAMALQYDNKVVIGGEFTQVDGFGFLRIARLLPNGLFDAGFNPGAGANGTVYSIASAPDGKVYLGGDFTQVNNTNRTRIARLAADGKLDLSFSNSVNGIVRAIALQANGQVVIGGDFTSVGGTPRNHIARLNGDGTLDAGFNPNINGNVYALVIQEDGRIIAGGSFNIVGTTNRSSLARLDASGLLDPSFVIGSGFNGAVNALAIQEDGRILAGGSFSTFNGTSRNNLARLLASGELDASFVIGTGTSGAINAIDVAPNDKIFIGGDFSGYNGVLVNRMARLKSNGALDFLFVAGAGANATIRAAVAQPDTAVVIGGDFTEVHGIARNYVARIHGDEKSNLASVEFASNLTVLENAGPAVLTLIRTGNTNVSFTLTWATHDITATNGLDYTGETNTVTFAAGQISAVINVAVFDDPDVEGDETFGVSLSGAPPNVDLSGVLEVAVTILDDEKALRFTSANYLVNEGATNAAITIARIGGLEGTISATFLTADGTALADGDYSAVSVPVTFGPGETSVTVLVPILDDPAGERAETVLLSLIGPIGGELGTPSTATLTIVDDDFSLGVTVRSNTTPIVIHDAQPANPYPSTINVSSLTGVVSQVQVQVVGLRHSFPSDIDALLVGPHGETVLLMSDAGGGLPVTNLTLTFADSAAAYLPSNSVLVTSTHRPTDYAPGDSFFGPAPAGPYGFALSPLVGMSPNGDWSLYVLDDRGGDIGVISNGWRLILTTVDLNKVADLSVDGTMTPPAAASGEVVVYSFSVSNAGPNAATSVVLSNPYPAGVAVLSAFASQGACTIDSSSVVCGLDFLPVGEVAQVEMKVIHGLGGSTTNIAVVSSGEPDVSVSNNIARVVSNITPGTTADLLVTMTDSPDPVLQGQDIVYTITVSNRGPLSATGTVLTDFLPENGTFVTASTSQGTLLHTGPSVVFQFGTLAPGAAATAMVLIQPRSGGFLTNSATATANEDDLSENSVSQVTSVSAAANLVLSMSDSSDPVGVNQTFGYNIVVYNAGPGVAENVSVFDILPAQFNFVSVNSSQGTNLISGGAIILQFGTIPFGSSATATILAQASIAGTFTNFATVIGAQQDPDTGNNSAAEPTQVFQLVTGSTNGGIQITRTTNAAQLAALVTGSGSTGIRVTDTRLLAHQIGVEGPASSGLYTLSTTPSTYGLRSPGIVLSTGDVLDYETGTNSLGSQTTSYGQRATTAQEALLDPITGGGTNNFTHNDVTQLDIDFDMLPGFSQVQFKVVFGSEEYPVFVNSSFIDGFGIYLNGENIAFSGTKPVNINHPDFKDIRGTELNGVLAPGGNPVVQFTASVVAGSSNNTLTFIIADTTDTSLDTTIYITSLEGGLAPNADLSVDAISTPNPVPIGSNFTYRIAVTNRGPDTTTNTVVTDVLPAGLTFNSATTSQGSYTVSNGVVTFNLGAMFRFIGAAMTINVTPQAAALYTNVITVASELADLRGSNNTAVVVSTVTDPGAFVVTTPITLSDAGPALVYPSVLNVSGFNGLVGTVNVTINSLSHTFPADIDILLVGPRGQRVVLMSDVGAGNDISNITLRFDDNAADALPLLGTIVSGTFRPTNAGADDVFAAPAPLGPYGSALSDFSGTDPNGDWSLYIMDDQGTDTGVLFGGWRLNFTSGSGVTLLAARVGANVVLSWPLSATGYSVQSAPDATGQWGPAEGTLSTADSNFVFTVQTTAQRLFFRLVKP